MMAISAAIFFIIISTTAWAQSAGKTIRSFCTDVGTVELHFNDHDDAVQGSYRIAVVAEPFNGALQGRFKEGLFEGEWTDKDGKGRIIIAFTGDLKEFTGVFNSYKNPAHWYITAWHGIDASVYNDLSADQRKDLKCN